MERFARPQTVCGCAPGSHQAVMKGVGVKPLLGTGNQKSKVKNQKRKEEQSRLAYIEQQRLYQSGSAYRHAMLSEPSAVVDGSRSYLSRRRTHLLPVPLKQSAGGSDKRTRARQ